jgi:ribosomal protein S18 acetylase RimI-like enzyme
MRVVVVRTYLTMNSPAEARPDFPDIPGLEMRPVEPADVTAYRETFEEIGREVLWVARESWQSEEWEDRVRSVHVRAWLARLDGVPAGLIELELQGDGSVHLPCLGVRPMYQGRGLGKYLISYLIERAWELEANRFWLFTTTLDGEHALGNYLKRGFRIWKRRARIVTVPDSLAPKARELVESARSRGVHPGFLRHVEAHLRESPPGILAKRAVFELKRAAGAIAKTSRS